jgi:magnesium chelatase accessory protein
MSALPTDRLVWERDGMTWPHRDASRFVDAAGLRWHVQVFGDVDAARPALLLLHGTGSSTHSWRGLPPLLASRYTVIAPDLPGHGFTAMPQGGTMSPQLSLPGMARAVSGLLDALDIQPAVVVGHSAGAAIAVRMCLDAMLAPQQVVSLNGALLPLGGLAGQVFSPVARLMAATSVVPRLFSWRASDPAVLHRLIAGTGSTLDPQGMALYGQLVRSPGHAAGALGMMANWDLPALSHQLPRLMTPLHLVVGENDRTVSPRQAHRVRAMLPAAAQLPVTTLQGLGHLAHEERPDLVARLLLDLRTSILDSQSPRQDLSSRA